MNIGSFVGQHSGVLITIGMRLLGAFALWIVGGVAIGAIKRAIAKTVARNADPTLGRYVESITGVALKILLIVLILGMFGVETTSFAALFAAAGVAIGMAWSGLLANFAAGVFLLIFRPFKVGDFISAGGTTGTVREIGLFVTTVDTADNVCTYVGNNKLFSESISNYSANPYRRVDLVMQLAHGVAPEPVMDALRARLKTIPHVLSTPTAEVAILEFNELGTKLAVRPYTSNANYWSVYFASQEAIVAQGAALGLPPPGAVRVMQPNKSAA